MISLLGLAEYAANYTTGDIDDIVTDNLGTAGVEVKNYMPLLILGLVLTALSTVAIKLIYAWKR